MPLIVHHAARADVLVDALADLMAEPLADPFAPEVVAVAARGMERWLAQRLARRLGSHPDAGGADVADGVAANIDMPSPAELTDRVLRGLHGIDRADDPWMPEALIWTILDLLADGGAAVPRVEPGGRYTFAARVARLFASYAAQRPTVLLDWTAGRDTDGADTALPADALWQPRLWRALSSRLTVPDPATRLVTAADRLGADPTVAALPDRLSVVGATRLPTDQLTVLRALADHRDVHLWITHPSPAWWDAIGAAPGRAAGGVPPRASLRAPARRELAEVRPGHPLLGGLGRDVSDLHRRLAPLTDRDHLHEPAPHGEPAPRTLLAHLQADLRADRPATRPADPRADGSIALHACHGRRRQVEVLREQVLHLLTADPTLELRDIVVMCPDVEAFAPHVRAVFGDITGTDALGAAGVEPPHSHPGRRLSVRLADRGIGATNPWLDVLAEAFDLARDRVPVSRVLELAGALPVRTRFRFDDDDLDTIRTWMAAAGARWGIGRRQRSAFGLADIAQGTVATAMDRVALGVAADEQDELWLGLALPLDEVGSSDIDLVGRWTEFLDRLAAVVRDLSGDYDGPGWAERLGRTLDLLTDADFAHRSDAAIARAMVAAAFGPGTGAMLSAADARALFAERLAARPTRSNFRTGELTVCTLVPMRSVPHRVIVLLGLDDEVYPRVGAIDGDDVLRAQPRVGERDPRSEDRQLLLDSIGSAVDALMIIHTGSDPITGGRRPPAVPVGALLDVLEDMVGPAVMEDIVVRHPLQPFDRRNFGAVAPDSHDAAALAGALAAEDVRPAADRYARFVLAPRTTETIGVGELMRFAAHPIAEFLAARLGVRPNSVEPDRSDELTSDLGPLDGWKIGDRIVGSLLTGRTIEDVRAAEWRRGLLPPFEFGRRALEQAAGDAVPLAAAAAADRPGEATVADIDVDLGDGRRLIGAVGGIHDGVIARASFSRLGVKQRMQGWIELLAVLADGRTAVRGAAISGRAIRGRRPVARAALLPPEDPIAVLRDLLDMFDAGMAQPLPVSPEAAEIYARRRESGDTPDEAFDAAERRFSDRFGGSNDEALRYCFGAVDFGSFATAMPAPPGEEPTAFGAYARRLWAPLLDAETVAFERGRR
ncbi:exodeoxyribonuclease V subunit gamma [Millisia brevis]|uniref:exodeoxyribonuclease V subunit gamma n=1 Tax=Millisia brevis TaxID=264148 RepID=UPI000A01D95B|nr:exodeoxyribonuclease V subunit gamma [Millisia brevis]